MNQTVLPKFPPVVPNFPPHLLHASPKERQDYFKDVRIKHPHRERNLLELDELASPSLDQRMILVIGGPGTGKSDLLQSIVTHRIQARSRQVELNPHAVPAIYVELEAPVRGAFDFGPYYEEGLEQMCSPIPDKTLNSIRRRAASYSIDSLDVEHARRSPSASSLKARYRKNCKERGVEIAALDEAVSAFKIANANSKLDRLEKLEAQANHIKSLVNKSSTAYMLAGAYDFFDLSIASGQLARRCRFIHVRPYDSSDKGFQGFSVALIGLLEHLPISHTLCPYLHGTELYLHCLGCIGILKDIMKAALVRAINREEILSIEILRQYFLPTKALQKIRSEIETGMKQLDLHMSMEELLEEDPLETFMPVKLSNRRKLKPGETTPSHRRDGSWGDKFGHP